MIAIMIRIRIKPFPACRRTEGRETAVIHSVYIIIKVELLSHGLDAEDFEQRVTVLAYQLECGVHHHVHTEEHEAERHHFCFLSPEQRVKFSRHLQLVLQDADACQLVPVHVLRLERRVVFLVHFHVLIL